MMGYIFGPIRWIWAHSDPALVGKLKLKLRPALIFHSIAVYMTTAV